MEMNELNKGFMKKALEDTVWEDLSESFAWSETLMIKYTREINWEKLSSNQNVLWKTSILVLFDRRLNWNTLSGLSVEYLFSQANLEKFEMYWNWSELSGNDSIEFSFELIDRFVDRWDWEKLIDNRSLDNMLNEEFLNKYSRYIPVSELETSRLWTNIVELEKRKLVQKILSTI